ncbi:MAG: hypothetical protein HKN25_17435 [Pyrinomonadaceae bacterium]|nr:hypothetical protein [Pyrinomonadaceae bacterium]
MANVLNSAFTGKSAIPRRVLANLRAQVSWVDNSSGERISLFGTTENVGETSALINLEVLPTVGADVNLSLFDDDKPIIETLTTVIRVERDPGKPQVALSVVKNLKKWQEDALTAAQNWVSRNLRLNYEEEWAN